LAGFIVGAVEKKEMLTGSAIKPGDLLIGLPSNGLHTNGYSLARKILFEEAQRPLDDALRDELLKVHRSYLKPIRKMLKAGLLKGAAHITGGGITDNLPRILPAGMGARIDPSTWKIPAIFEELRSLGQIPMDDYRRTFNLGIGMIFAVGKRKAAAAQSLLKRLGDESHVIGEVIQSETEQVIYAE
jgi:phosphoribosylformylglycinamidine cyclo-ligase